jgi:hypothetical protein
MTKQSIVMVLLLGLMAVGSASAQENRGKVAGKVVLDDASLPGATVVLENAESRFLQVTNAEGRFEFFNVPPGDYRLSAELVGLKSRPREHLAVIVGDATEITFRMRIDKSQSICLDCGNGPMTLPDGTFVITRDMLENFPTN